MWDPSDSGTQPRGKQVEKPGSIWYTPTTGIWQTVWLEPVSEEHIDDIHITPDLDASKVRITVRASGLKGPGLVAVVIRDPAAEGKVVAGERIRIDAATGTGTANIAIPDCKPWSPDSPHLYDLELTLDASDAAVDSVKSYFGMRKISLGKDDKGITRLFLNNKFVFQLGPLDQGYWPDGLYTAPADEALRYDLEITKQLGFNMTRKHVKIEPARWYYWADKIGLLVWQDMPSGDASIGPGFGEINRSGQSARQFETELRAMIDGLRNHPSIVHWVVFNEGWGQFDTKRLTEWVKSYDPSRLVISASGWNDLKVGDMHDVHAYPPPRSPDPEPSRAAVNGEYGGLGLPIEGHTWQEKNNWGYQKLKTVDELVAKYAEFMDRVHILKGSPGLSAAVYTQITDVEIEVNGLLTYDREVIKGDVSRYHQINQSVHGPSPTLNVLLPTSVRKARKWRYTFEKPADNWMESGFDDSMWKLGEAGFGKVETPNSKVRTNWTGADIWIRQEFELPDRPLQKIFLEIHHDDNAEIYINGKLAAKLEGWTSDYQLVPLSDEARALLKPGKNTLAVFCHQDKGGQYIDVGLVERVEP